MTQIATSEPPPLATRLLKAPAKSVVLAAATVNVVLACLGVLLPDGASTVLGTLPILIVAWCLGALAAVPIVLIAALASSLAPLTSGAGPEGWTAWGSLAGVSIVAHMAAALATGAMRRAYLRERHLAEHDPLTGAMNRRAFFEALDATGASAAASGQTHLLLYIDLDGFKAVNDSCGHAAGDKVLRHLSQSISASLRPGELFARVGGDEFVALIAQESGNDPYSQAQDWHDAVTASLGTLGYKALGCSMGAVVIMPPASPAREALVRWADALMYEVKRAGKGSLRICHAPALAA
jgi:diguanylate cyclase (GGDEF)-like protein